METSHEKVCTRCGTLNDERCLTCVRCGETLEMSEEKKLQTFKKRLINEKLFLFTFISLFLLYSFGAIFYVGPWFYNILIRLVEKYMVKFSVNLDLIFLAVEILYTLFLSLVSYSVTAIILYSTMGTKLMRINKLNSTCFTAYILMLLCFITLSICKHNFDIVIIIEHFMSVIITFPYIRGRILNRSI